MTSYSLFLDQSSTASATEVVGPSDLNLSSDLASTASGKGSAMVGYDQGGSGSVARTVDDKLSELRFNTDKSGNFTAQVNSWQGDLTGGGKIYVAPGTLTMTAGVTIDTDCFAIEGDGRTATTVNPNFTGTVFDLDNAGGTLYQPRIKGLGFYSANAGNKTLVHLKNTAGAEVAYNHVSTGAIQGSGSIGVLIEGRELNHIHDNVWAIAKPIKVIQNPLALNISTDYMVIEREHCITTEATEPCIEFADSVYLTNTVIRDTALVGGAEGIKGTNTSFAAISYCFSITNTRREQIDDANAFSYHLDYTTRSLINFDFSNNYASIDQKGFYGRGIKRALLRTSIFPQISGDTALDYTIPTGGSLTLLECEGGVDGVKTITNGHKVFGVPSRITGDPIGSIEHWSYFETPADPGGGGTYVYDNVPEFTQGAVQTASFQLTVPTGSRFIRLPLIPATMLGGGTVGAEVFARSPSGRYHAFYPVGGAAPTIIAATGDFASTATANKIYGYADGLIAENLVAATTIRVEVRQ